MCVNLSVPEAPRSYNGLVAGNKKEGQSTHRALRYLSYWAIRYHCIYNVVHKFVYFPVKVVAVAYDRFLIIGL